MSSALGYAGAVGAALIWAYAVVAYRPLVLDHGSPRVNSVRLAWAALAALGPAVYMGLSRPLGDLYAIMSGAITLSVGDTLYLMAIGAAGASVAAPVAYTYVVLSQFAAIMLGEPLTVGRLAAAALIVLGVYMLSSGPAGRSRLKGVAYALGTALAWTVGQAFIGVSYRYGLSPVSIAFLRAAAAAVIVSTFVATSYGAPALKRSFSRLSRTYLPIVAAADLALGSALFAYSVGTVGLGPAVILNGTMPLFTQALAWLIGGERPRPRDIAGASAIVAAIAVMFVGP